MVSKINLNGSLVALVTPMLEDGSVDWDNLNRLVEFHLAEGTHGIVPTGTTGESATLEIEEHIRVIESVVKQAGGRAPVIAGTGANATREAITWSQMACDVGADACLLVTPYYNRPTQEGLYRHYMAIAEEVNIPQLLYNVPSRTACDLLPETAVRLAAHPNIVGIKEAAAQPDRVADILDHTADFVVLSGEDFQNLALMERGATGCISVTANVAPALMARFCAAANAGDKALALKLHQQLIPLHKSLFVESNPIPVKWALQQMGLIGPGIRLPLTPLSADKQAIVKESLQVTKLLP